jgi:hypothetical protein
MVALVIKMVPYIIASMSSRGNTTATTTVTPDGESNNSKVSRIREVRDPPVGSGEAASKKAAGKSGKMGQNADVSVMSGSGSASRGRGGGLIRSILVLFRNDTFALFFLMAVSTGLSIVVAVTDLMDDFREVVYPHADMTTELYEVEYRKQSFSLPQMVNAFTGMCDVCFF